MQVRDYDAIIGHTTVVFCRFLFMSLEQRLATDQKTAGELFFACCAEVRDVTLLEALQLAFSLLRDKVKALAVVGDDLISSLFDEALGAVIDMLRLTMPLALRK
jgi:hypothetical protein